MLEQIKISILIPVYNVNEMLLRRCIESSINQTLKEIEIIIVDDGSDENTAKICDSYRGYHQNLKIIHKINAGLSAARNTAFRNSVGEYVMFLDGDDYLDPDACAKSYAITKEKKYDVVFWDIVTTYQHGNRVIKTIDGDSQEFNFNGCKNLQARVLEFNGHFAQVFGRIIKRELLDQNNIYHIDKLKQGAEGLVFNFLLFEKVESAFYLSEGLNYYVYNDKSISHSHNEDNYFMIVKCFEELERLACISNNKLNLRSKVMERFLYAIITTAISGYFNPQNDLTFSEKKDGMNKYLENPFVKHVLINMKISNLDKKRQFILLCIKKRRYLFIEILAHLRHLEYKIR